MALGFNPALMNLCPFFAVIVAAAASCTVMAVDESAPAFRPLQELFKSKVIYPQEQGEWQLGFMPWVSTRADRTEWAFPLSVEYGITKALEVELEWSPIVGKKLPQQEADWGMGDLELLAQYSFMQLGHTNFHTALGLAVSLPTGDIQRDLTEGFIEYEPYLTLAWDIPALKQTQVFVQAGPSLVQRVRYHTDPADDERSAHGINLNTGVIIPLGRFVLSTEISWRNNQWNHGGDENEWYVTPGIHWHATRNVELKVGVPVGLNRTTDDFGVIAGVIWEF